MRTSQNMPIRTLGRGWFSRKIRLQELLIYSFLLSQGPTIPSNREGQHRQLALVLILLTASSVFLRG